MQLTPTRFIFTFLFFSTSAITQASNSFNKEGDLSGTATLTASEKRKLLDDDLAFLIAPIKSKADIKQYVRATPKTRSPLNLLSDSGRKAFLKNLTFNQAGLTGLDYSSLEAELTPTQIYQVLALFGQQSITPMIKNARIVTDMDAEIMSAEFSNSKPSADKCVVAEPAIKSTNDTNAIHSKGCDGNGNYQGYWCISPHTCAWKTNYICLSTC